MSPVATAVTAEALYGELRSLCKGLGLRHPRVRDRTGHALRAACSVTSSTTHHQARQLLAARLREAVAELPDGPRLRLRQAASVALALDESSRSLLVLGERQHDAAAQWRSDVRTVRRRCDHALRLLGAILAREPDDRPPASTGWYYDRLSVFIRMDMAQPQMRLEGTIVAEINGLTEIELSMCAARHPKERRSHIELEAEVEYGAGSGSLERRADGGFAHRLLLPGPLSLGQRHTYSHITRIPDGQRMSPFFGHTPQYRCEQFDLHVKFDPRSLPKVVWAVAAASKDIPQPDVPVPGSDIRTMDGFGEVHVSFSRLRPGRRYGLHWIGM